MRSAQLSIVVPTFKERGNVAELVRRLDLALAGIAWEAIFVDDNSPDGTADAFVELTVTDAGAAVEVEDGTAASGRIALTLPDAER